MGKLLQVGHCSDIFPITIFYTYLSIFLASECGEDITTPTGRIKSPDFPSTYPPDMTCTWIISPTKFGGVQITFDYFELQSGCSFPACDYLVVRNGTDSNSAVVGIYNGTLDIEQIVLKSSDGFHIFFKSDNNYTYGGFRINYQPSAGKLVINKDAHV